jgi:hypothetical protein
MPDSDSFESAQELDDLPLRPAAIVAVGLREKGAVASVRTLDEAQIRIFGNLPPRLGKDTNKWIVGGVQN